MCCVVLESGVGGGGEKQAAEAGEDRKAEEETIDKADKTTQGYAGQTQDNT